MKHLDLFSGIGGFALAVEEVWPNVEHVFCDNDSYCQRLLKLRFPNSKIYGDIKEIKSIADADWNGLQKQRKKQQAGGNRQLFKNTSDRILDTRSDSDSDGDRLAIGKKKVFMNLNSIRVEGLAGSEPLEYTVRQCFRDEPTGFGGVQHDWQSPFVTGPADVGIRGA